MIVANETPLEADWLMAFDRDGRELVAVVIKATFAIPQKGKNPQLAEKQVPLTATDVHTGEPGFSAVLYESDYAHQKPRCDVLLKGSAYAPGGKPTDRVKVSLQVGSMTKSFDVVGNRVWRRGILLATPTTPEPFTVMPISYNNAFGGVDRSQEDPSKHRWYQMNHAGVGYHAYLEHELVDGKPLPNTEETGRPVSDPRGKYKPMAFGPVGRNWQPRIKHAGTYDQSWLDTRSPFWPDDFDYRFFQAAAEDQQIPYPTGGEDVVLTNLTPEGVVRFRLPEVSVPVVFVPVQEREHEANMVLDTILIEPDEKRFSLAWRTTVPMKRSCFDIKKVVVGKTLRAVRREHETHRKVRFANLDELIKAQRKR